MEKFQNSPRMVAFIMGLPYGAAIFLCLLIVNDISLSMPKPKKLEVFLAVTMGLTGTLVLSEVGTTFNDIPISVIVLLALLFELKKIDQGSYKGIFSGVLLGLAAGLKITSTIFAPAMLVAILITSKSFSSAWRSCILFCIFWGIGFLISGGFWVYELFTNFGNPIFPFFNSVFHSPWFALIGAAKRDMQFMPHNGFEAVFYPFFWLSGKITIAENPIRDGRYAVAFTAIVIYGLFYVINKIRPAILSTDSKAILKNTKVLLIVSFFTLSYIVWEILFSIGRYAIPLEILTGLVFLIGYKLCFVQFDSTLFLRVIVRPDHVPPVVPISFDSTSFLKVIVRITAVLILVAIPATSLPINWGRLQYSQGTLHPSVDIRVPHNSIVLVFGKPIAYIIPFIDSPGSVYFGFSEGVDDLPATSPPIISIRSRLKENTPIFILTNASDAQGSLLKIADLMIDTSLCKVMNDPFQPEIKLCPVHQLHQ
jgi:hypothetical protein